MISNYSRSKDKYHRIQLRVNASKIDKISKRIGIDTQSSQDDSFFLTFFSLSSALHFSMQ